jgi:hypothetical protein
MAACTAVSSAAASPLMRGTYCDLRAISVLNQARFNHAGRLSRMHIVHLQGAHSPQRAPGMPLALPQS